MIEHFMMKIKLFYYRLLLAVTYYNEYREKQYPYRLSSEYFGFGENSAQIRVKCFGARNDFTISVKDIYLNKSLLSKFPPNEISSISLITYCEIFVSGSIENKHKKFKTFRDATLASIAQND